MSFKYVLFLAQRFPIRFSFSFFFLIHPVGAHILIFLDSKEVNEILNIVIGTYVHIPLLDRRCNLSRKHIHLTCYHI